MTVLFGTDTRSFTDQADTTYRACPLTPASTTGSARGPYRVLKRQCSSDDRPRALRDDDLREHFVSTLPPSWRSARHRRHAFLLYQVLMLSLNHMYACQQVCIGDGFAIRVFHEMMAATPQAPNLSFANCLNMSMVALSFSCIASRLSRVPPSLSSRFCPRLSSKRRRAASRCAILGKNSS